MTAQRRAARRTWAGVIAVLAAVVPAVALGPRPADAHTVLRGSTPAAGTQVAASPMYVGLDFAEAPDAALVQVAVLDSAGVELASGPAEVAGTALRQPVRPVTIAGAVTVNYRIASADGHPVQGTIAYTVTSAPPADAINAPPPPSLPVTPNSAAPSIGASGGAGPQRLEATGAAAVLLPVGLLASLIGLAAALAFWPRRRITAPETTAESVDDSAGADSGAARDRS